MADNSGDKQNSLFVVKWKYTHRSGTSGTGCAPAVRSRPQPAGCWSLRQSTVEIRRSGYIQLNFISKSSFRRKSQNGHWMRTSHTGCEKLCSGCPWPSLRSAKWSSKVRSADIFIWSTERAPCCNKTSIYCSLFDSFRFPVAQGKLDFNSAQTKSKGHRLFLGLNACLQQPIRYSPFTVHAKLAYKDQLIRTLCKCDSFWSLGTLWKALCLFFTDCNTVKNFQLQTHSMAETSKRQLITLQLL